METRRRHSASGCQSGSDDRNRAKKSQTAKSNESDSPKSKHLKEKDKYKNSYIPVLKGEKADTGKSLKIQGKSSSASRIHRTDTCAKIDDLEEKLRQIQEKEKSIADYYIQIEDLIQKFIKEQDEKLEAKDHSWRGCAKKMISEPVFNRGLAKNILSEFEVNVHQISDIWLATTANLSSAFKNFKNNPTIHPIEVEMENVKIQLAIKQAKSLTLVKTRDVIEDVRKLLQNREVIRTELEKLISDKNIKVKCVKCGTVKNVLDKGDEEFVEESKTLGKGDSYKRENFDDQGSTSTDSPSDETGKHEGHKKDSDKFSCYTTETSSVGRGKSSGETEGADATTASGITSDESKDSESWERELNKKNETITNLNNKIFKLQKTLNEQSAKFNELQVKLSECDEKIQWNQVLWKQIGKLKEQIKCLQHSNKQLETQKKELVCRMSRLDQEIDRLVKMNELLNKKKFLLSTQEQLSPNSQEGDANKKSPKEWENRGSTDEKTIAEKQGAITQLQTILNIMTDQRNLAQQQICLYQTKIEELETMLKKNNPL